uniref:Zinc finger protein 513 n=1 Tax=Oryzias latipes TaxID=8090 RepID=H2MNW3_ORYLA
MPRKKQQNPQPVKLDSEDGVAIEAPGNLHLDTDLFLGHDLEFDAPDHDKILGLEKFSAAEIGFSVFPLGDESSAYSQLSMESETDNSRSTSDNGREDESRASQSESSFPPYLSCRGCGQLRDELLGPGMDLVGSQPECELGDEEGDQSTSGEDKLCKQHSCHLCGFSSRYANHVKRHMKTHNGEKPFNCPLCTYASAQLVNLQRHLRIHTGEKPYKCSSCSFACSSLGNLKRHQRMHVPSAGVGQDTSLRLDNPQTGSKKPVDLQRPNGEASASGKVILFGPAAFLSSSSATRGSVADEATIPPSLFPFTCRLCGVVLEDEDGSSAQICAKCTLDMLTKDSSSSPNSPGERSDKVYTCSACPFLTHYPNHLARHMKTHSGEKPYKCPQCDYASAHFDNLKRHHRVHTGEKPYKCHLCDYACGNLANLKRHQRVHSGAKPFQCTLCSYNCNQSMNLKRHMLRHTGEKPYKCQECGYTTGHWDNYKRHQKKHGLATDSWVKVPMTDNNEEEDARNRQGEKQDESQQRKNKIFTLTTFSLS